MANQGRELMRDAQGQSVAQQGMRSRAPGSRPETPAPGGWTRVWQEAKARHAELRRRAEERRQREEARRRGAVLQPRVRSDAINTALIAGTMPAQEALFRALSGTATGKATRGEISIRQEIAELRADIRKQHRETMRKNGDNVRIVTEDI